MDWEAYEASCDAWEEAGLGEADWQTALDLTEKALKSTGVIVHAVDKLDAKRTDILLQSRLVPREANELYTQFAPYDLRRPYGLRAASGEVVVDESIAPLRELDRTMVYADLYRKFDFGRCAAVRLDGVRKLGSGAPSRVVILNVLRGNCAETTSDEYRRCVRGMAQTVQRALRTATVLEALRATNAAKMAGLDLAPFGILFVRGQGVIIEANAVARQHLAARDALGCAFGVMTVFDLESRAKFLQALGRVSRGSNYEVCAAARKEQRPLGIAVMPNSSTLGGAVEIDAPIRADAIVLIFDPEQAHADSKALWREMFALTGAEADVAELLMIGLSMREIGLQRGVSFETVRSQCKRINAKLGVDGQSEAVLLLSRLVTPRRR